MEYISNFKFQHMISRGAKKVITYEKDLNAINVFPVADGDTGSNLAYLMNMILRRQHTVSQFTFEQLKKACLEGSRGNSGMIFSQFIIAMCDFMADKTQLTKEQFVEMCEHSVTKTYKAVHQPVEGTILTVMRDWVRGLNKYKQRTNSVIELMLSSLQAASESLEQTKYIQEECRKKNVVDAGAKGFFYFLQGCVDGLTGKGDELPDFLLDNSQLHYFDELASDKHHISEDTLHYRYCTEFIVEKLEDNSDLKAQLATLGDSIVFIQSESMCKFHIHTDTPEIIAHYVQSKGQIAFQKVEDMRKQQQMLTNRKSTTAIVIDSACDLPQAIIDQYDIYMLPLSIQVNSSNYLDKQTLTAEQLYHLMDGEQQPSISTSLPSREQMTRLYSQLLAQYEHIISIHVSSKLSGTFAVCKQIAYEMNNKRISVIDSKSLSGAYGLIVRRVASYVQKYPHATQSQIIDYIDDHIKTAQIYVTVPSLKSMVASGRVSSTVGKIAETFRLKPIVTLDKDGKSKIIKPTLFKKSNLPNLISLIKTINNTCPINEYAILYTDQNDQIEWIEEQLYLITGKKASYITTVSSVIGKYAGKGAYSIACL